MFRSMNHTARASHTVSSSRRLIFAGSPSSASKRARPEGKKGKVEARLADLRQLGLNDEPLDVVGEHTGLKGDYTLARDGLCELGFVGLSDDLVEDPVGVCNTI